MNDIYRTNVLGVGVSSVDMKRAVSMLLNARFAKESGYVCVTGVHGVIESQRDEELRRIHNRSFLTVPDGMPTVWMGREQGFTKMGRVYGPDLMLEVCRQTAALNQKTEGRGLRTDDSGLMEGEAGGLRTDDGGRRTESIESSNSAYAYPSQDETGVLDFSGGQKSEDRSRKSEDGGQKAEDGRRKTEVGGQSSAVGSLSSDKKCLTHFLYGATEEMLAKLKTNLESRFPGIQIVGTYSPPFRPLNEEEEVGLRQIVADYKPDFFWVGLSTPKQEKFMAAHANNSDFGIMLGVGAAFPIHAGLQKDAPEWVKNSGLQWFYRLCQEPRRLWRRYLDIVPKFLWLAFLQVLGIKRFELENGGQMSENRDWTSGD